LILQIGDTIVRDPGLTSFVIVLASVLIVSRLPTPSIKYMHLPKPLMAVAYAALGAFLILLINWPWATLTGGFILYAASIPFTYFRHKDVTTPAEE
jgi:phosphatidylserine synthase